MAAINDIVGRAQHTLKPNAQYAYIAPYYSQAKRVAWDYLLKATEHIRISSNIAELTVIITTHVGQAKIMLFGADNPDAIRGIYLDGCVIDEPADMRPRVFSEIIRPLLADREGWCVFIGTPKGKNEFWRLKEEARQHPTDWFLMTLKASSSGLLKQKELDDSRRIMSEDEYDQEFECSFDAAIKGSYYGRILNDMAHRITDVPYEPTLPVHVVMDLGYTDSTAIWFWQAMGDEIRYIESFERSGLAIGDYVDELRARPYRYGEVWLPHDARAKSLQTGRSILELLHKQHGIKARIVPELSVQQGIQAARFVLTSEETFIDAANCYDGVEALRQYQREWDDKKQAFKEQPKHDHTSHYADSFRYSGIVAHRGARDFVNRFGRGAQHPAQQTATPRRAYDPTKPFGGQLVLNDLWAKSRPRSSGRI